MKYIKITKENLEKEHICCAISNNEDVKDALFNINRDLPREALDDAYRQLITFNSPMLEVVVVNQFTIQSA